MAIARALVEGREDRAAMAREAAALGLAAEFDEPEPDVEVYPEHWESLSVFAAMGTQINVAGMGGVIGYRYEALPVVLDIHGIPVDRRRDVFDDFRVLEAETVRLIRERSNRG